MTVPLSSDICQYQLPDALCRDPADDGRCLVHAQAYYRICTSCSGQATRACPSKLPGGVYCVMPLCPECVHVGDGEHVHMSQVNVTNTEEPSVRATHAAAEKDITSLIGRILVELAAEGVLSFADKDGPTKVANEVRHGIELHLLVMHLSGMARMGQQS